VLEHAERCRAERARLERAEVELERAEAELSDAQSARASAASRLSELRRDAAPALAERVRHVPVDLLDAAATAAAFRGVGEVTHLFYCGYAERSTAEELIAINTAMLRHALDGVEAAAPDLERVVLIEGTKYYGSHLGPFKTPAKESDPRIATPHFYYAQEDLLIERQAGKSWSWAALRPHSVCGFALGSPMNLLTALGTYGAICRELGQPFAFPGKPRAFETLYQVTDAGLLSRAMVWAATSPGCANQAFNLTNGDLFRWRNLWPRLAEFFGVPAAEPLPMKLVEWMADKAPVWERIVAKHGLQPHRFGELASWPFADYVFATDYDVISDMGKARRHGFCESVDSEAMFLDLLAGLREQRILP
jgi:nucleoside-diphosphate-sugar epimerase